MSSNYQHHISSNYIKQVDLQWLLLLSGNVERNPGPPKTRNKSDANKESTSLNTVPCGKTDCPDAVSDNSVECVFCKKWFHALCADLTDEEIDALSNTQMRWVCESCEERIEEIRGEVNSEKDLEKEELVTENKMLMEKVNSLDEKVKNHQVLEQQIIQKNCDMAGKIAALESELKSSDNTGEDNRVLKERVIELENDKEMEKKLQECENSVKHHQLLEKELVKKNLDMAGKIAALQSELDKYTNGEIQATNEKVKKLEAEIEQHEKLAAELTKDKSKESVPDKKAEMVNLKKQVGRLEKQNNEIKADLDKKTVKLESIKLEIKREKDINDILITQIKDKQNGGEDTGIQSPPAERRLQRQVSSSAQDNSISIEGEYIDVDADFCEKEYRMGSGKCMNEGCTERHDIDFTKRGVCLYEYQEKGSCKRGSYCWFTHQIPRWYKTAPDVVQEMRMKSERMKNRTRVITNQKRDPSVWRTNGQSQKSFSQSEVMQRHYPVWQSNENSQQSVSQSHSETNQAFLEMISKMIAETINSQKGINAR